MSIRLKQIEVLRARGISSGESFTVRDLAPRLNLISGPNGSGKSTLALAIRQTLWPSARDLESAFLHAEWEHDGASVTVDIEGGYPTRASVMPDVGPAERRGRYLLALHDMVVAETDSESEFVQRLVRDAMGGVDLAGAEARLRWSTGPTRPLKLERALNAAEKAVREALGRQRELAADEDRLADLDAAIRKTEAAESELQAVRLARVVKTHQEELDVLERRMAEYPDAVRTLRGSESRDLARIREEIGRLEVEEAKLDQARARAHNAIKQSGFDEQPPSDADLESWISGARRLEDLERRRSEAAGAVSDSRTVLDKAWSVISEVGSHPEGGVLEREHAHAWNELWKEWASHHVRVLGLDAQRSMIERLLDSDRNSGAGRLMDPDPAALDLAQRILARWLRSAPDTGWSMPLMVALILLTIACLVLAWLVSPLFGLGVLIPVALYLWNRAGTDPTASRAYVETEWRREGVSLDAPQWTEESVLALYNRLGEAKAGQDIARAAHSRLDALDDQARQLEHERSRLSGRTNQLEADSGLRVKDHMEDAAWLGTLAQRMVIVDKAREELARSEGTLAAVTKERNALLERLNGSMGRFLDGPLVDSDHAVAAVNSLAKRTAEWNSRKKDLEDAREALEVRVRPALAKWREEESDLLSRVGLDGDTAWQLDRLLEQFEAYGSVATEHMKREGLLADARARFAEAIATGTADTEGEALESLTLADLKARESGLEELVAGAEGLREKRTTIRTNIEHARQGYELTRALEERDAVQGQLQALRHEARQQLAGQVVAEHVRTEAMKRSIPAVFSRAQDLLARFTSGALRLEVDLTSETPRMVAKSDSGVARSMGHLSVGERVQVLMAVRVAFLEHEEPLALPLLVDEALGTSDDDRARTIIDTLLQLAVDGRQIFYFTAQSDELSKWTERISQHGGFSDGDWTRIDLADVRNLEAARRSPLPAPREPVERDLPAPGHHSHADYLRVLGVPGLEPLTRAPGQEHIGHVVEDTQQLYALLRARVDTVHAWETLDGTHSPMASLDADNAAEAHAFRAGVRARIAVLKDAVDLWRRGRGRPVDRSVLEASGAVSATHMESATDLARRVGGEASRVLAGLEAGEVSRFHKAKITELRDWLLDHDYLDPAAPLGADAARIQLLARHQEVPPETIDRIVHLLWTTD
ncbi:MAG: AAA family ATPase [Rhodothermales bacterium]